MKRKKTIIYACGSVLVLSIFPLSLWMLRDEPTWTHWAGEPLICREVVSIVWVRLETSEKKSYKKFTDAEQIKAILTQIATAYPGEYDLHGKEKHELRIYFLDGENYHVYFAVEGEEIIGPNGRNHELFQILHKQEEATPFWGDMTPEEVEEQCELMKELIREKKKLRRIGL